MIQFSQIDTFISAARGDAETPDGYNIVDHEQYATEVDYDQIKIVVEDVAEEKFYCIYYEVDVMMGTPRRRADLDVVQVFPHVVTNTVYSTQKW